MSGKFITFEGIDGSGKSSAADAVYRFLRGKGIDCILTRQPGGTIVGESLRTILKTEAMSGKSEVLLFAAAFKESLDKIIVPAIHSGKWVICDRYTDSTVAYQSGGRGVSPLYIREILDTVGIRKPDMSILFHLPAEEGLRRVGVRGELDRFEAEGISFQERIQKQFYEIFDRYHMQNRFKINTLENDQQATAEQAISLVSTLVNEEPAREDTI